MTYTENKFIEIISNYINGIKEIDILPEEIDTKRMKELFKIHRLMGIGYSYLKDYEIEGDLIPSLESGFFSEVTQYQRRQFVFQRIKEILTKQSIKHVCFKGSYLGNYYPVKELRTMSDLDIYIAPADRDRGRKILIEKGADPMEKVSDSTVDVYNFHSINIEVHNNLVSDGIWMNGVNFEEYYKNIFDKCELMENCTYKINDNDHLVYLIFHAAKHFYESGIGVRMLMDFPIIVRNSDHIDWDYVWQELEKIKLDAFASKIFIICGKIFGEFGVCYKNKPEFEQADRMIKFIIDGGVYGFSNKSGDVRRLRNKSATKDGKQNLFVGTIRMLFPSSKEMRRISEWYANKPAILLPVAYAGRIIVNIKERGGLFKVLKSAPEVYNDSADKSDILKIMNL
ncbi:MAG: nucleotidyltransferase family protein [Lachnospiraceae bacterium]|nr:nucleotidyltransferase family protein [Lachnospiraceae bacterium]